MGILDDIPDDIKQRLRNSLVDLLARLVETVPGAESTARAIRQLSSQAVFFNAFDKAVKNSLKRFVAEYNAQDKDLVNAISNEGDFWKSKNVRQALIELVSRQGAWLVNEQTTVVQHFVDILPERIDRERVDKAVNFLLRCILEELWTLPGVKEIREIYNLQFQKMSVETARQQLALMEAQLQATKQLGSDVREALLQLATTFEQPSLAASLPQPSVLSTQPYHNLFQPDYPSFIGRQKELDWMCQRLSPKDRAWQMVIAGIGGVGKSSLALAVAHNYREHYQELPPEDRFEAIIWITAKEEVLTIDGPTNAALPGLTFHTLEDMYTTIAQTLEREDITRAILEEQDYLVHKALSTQRTLLIVDNLESVKDKRVKTFLRNLPPPTKCIVTSREWIDVADVLKLIGLPPEEAKKMIFEEASIRGVDLSKVQQEQLFKRTYGLPLPIKLSVARIASGETFDQVIRWLGNTTGDLPEYCIKGQIDLAHQGEPHAWKLLLACWLFDQDAGASRDALGYIADLSIADRDDGLTLLQRLSMLTRTEDDRFWMLPMVHGYIGAEFAKADFAETLIDRWLDWMQEFTQAYGIDLELHVERAQKIDPEYANLVSAIRWCHQHERKETLLRLVEGTSFYLYLVGLDSEFMEILETAVLAARALQNEQCMGRFLRQLARPLRVLGQYEKSLDYLKKAEEIAFRYKDEAELGRTMEVYANILYNQGFLKETERVARTILEIGERLNDLELKARAAQRLAESEAAQQQFDKALEWLDQSEKWCSGVGWSRGLAWNAHLRGKILIRQGNAAAAEPFLIQSQDMATSWGERRLVTYNKHRRAEVYLVTGQLQLAFQIAEEARDLCERLGLVRKLAQVEELLLVLQELQ